MTITPLPLIDLDAAGPAWPDEVADLTDRRRLLLRALFGLDVPGAVADAVFAPERAEGRPPVGERPSS